MRTMSELRDRAQVLILARPDLSSAIREIVSMAASEIADPEGCGEDHEVSCALTALDDLVAERPL